MCISDSGSPGIPTPDYDTMTTVINSSPEPKIEINRMRISSPEPSLTTSYTKNLVKKTKSDPRTKTFSKRHPPVVESVSNSSGASSGGSTSGPLNSRKVSKSSSTEALDGMQEKVPAANYFELVRHVHAAESEAGDQFNFGPSQMQVID